MIAKVIECLRVSIVVVSALVITHLFQGDPVQQLHYLMPWLVLSLSGLSGIESIFFGKQAAFSLGRRIDRPYQLQSGMNSLSVALVAALVWWAGWGLYADMTVLLCTLFFITLSALVHMWALVSAKNLSIKNALRGVMVIFLWWFLGPLFTQVLTKM